MDLKRQANFKF